MCLFYVTDCFNSLSVSCFVFSSVVDPPFTIYMGKDKYESKIYHFSIVLIVA